MAAFQTPIDIASRACQHVGARRLLADTTIAQWAADVSQEAGETYFAYDKIRQAELNRNLWICSTRRVALRALDATSSLLDFEAWSNAYTYVDGSTGYPAAYVVTHNGQTWVSLTGANTAEPGVLPAAGSPLAWDSYFGSLVANAWNDTIQNSDTTTNNTSYHVGEIAYLLTTGAIYVSIVEGNQNEPDTVDQWSGVNLYQTGAVVAFGGVNYQSLANQNFGIEPDTSPTKWTTTITKPAVSGSWIQLSGASLLPNTILYPITAGPASDTRTRNVFLLPAGFLRAAPQAPKVGARAFFGAHVGLPYDDWERDGPYLLTDNYRTRLMLRFVADVQDVTTMNPKLCEAIAADLGRTIAPRIDPSKIQACEAAYRQAISEAAIIDAIEAGPVEQSEDEYISVRI